MEHFKVAAAALTAVYAGLCSGCGPGVWSVSCSRGGPKQAVVCSDVAAYGCAECTKQRPGLHQKVAIRPGGCMHWAMLLHRIVAQNCFMLLARCSLTLRRSWHRCKAAAAGAAHMYSWCARALLFPPHTACTLQMTLHVQQCPQDLASLGLELCWAFSGVK
jgi:hypothetical protein